MGERSDFCDVVRQDKLPRAKREGDTQVPLLVVQRTQKVRAGACNTNGVCSVCEASV